MFGKTIGSILVIIKTTNFSILRLMTPIFLFPTFLEVREIIRGRIFNYILIKLGIKSFNSQLNSMFVS